MDRKKHEKLGKVGLMSLTILTALMFVFVSVVLANPEGVLDANFDFDWQGDASGEVLSAYTEQESNVLSGPWNYLYGRSVLTECELQNTEIVFYENAGEIKVCIRALSPEVQGIIESGSISMSISEEYDLDYFTGLAYGIRAEGPYQYLNSGMNKIEKSALFLSGFIPGIGPGFGIVQYVDDMKDPNEFDWYEQWDMTLDSSQPCMYIARDYFESNEALNTRDIAVIPWYKPIYVLSFSEVVLYPPALPVQDYQSDNIAFRVEYAVSSCRDNKGMLNLGKKIRLDVLIPIEIEYTYDWTRDGFVEEIRDPEEVETVEEIIEEITATPKPTPKPTPAPTNANAQSKIAWHDDQEGMQIAKSQNKPTMILFSSARCPACAMLADELVDTRVINMSKNFVPVIGSRELDSQYGIRYVPTLVFTDSQGMEVHRIVGYRDADTLMQEMQKVLMLSTTLDVPFFSQRDPAWRDKKLDHSTYSFGEYGCVLTSAAMVAKYFGCDTDPDKLNTSLTAVGGLDTSGIIHWEKVADVSDGKVAWIESVGTSWSRIDQELSSENPVISSVNCPLGLHFIVFVGKSGDEHYFLDPYDKQRTIQEWPNGAHGVYTLKNLKIYHRIPTTLVG